MDRKDKFMLWLSGLFILASVCLLVLGGSGKISRIFADWDDNNSDSDAGEYSEDWIATEVTGKRFADDIAQGMYRLKAATSYRSYTAGTKNTYTVWVSPTSLPTGQVADPLDGSYSRDFGAVQIPEMDALDSTEKFTISRWRVYGHIHK